MEDFPFASVTILIPLLSAIYILVFVERTKNPNKILYSKYVAILSTILTIVSSLCMIFAYKKNDSNYQFVENYKFIEDIGLNIHFGIDGFSIYFIFLTAILTPICILISLYSITKRVKEFLVCFLILESFVIGAFCSLNLLLFYIFFEAVLIPMYLIIGMWGGSDRVYAAFKFFLYTLAGSILFLITIIYLFLEFGTLSIPDLVAKSSSINIDIQKYLWVTCFIAMAVKIPMWPVHTWLPDAHVQAPTGGSVILAGILLKLGGYGFLRILIPLFKESSIYFANFVIILSVIAIIYASLVAFAQTDMKKMIAYSSIAHMGYVTAGIFSFSSAGIHGAMFQMFSHGVVSAALFIVVGVLYDRMHTKEIKKYGGVAEKMPVLAFLFMIFMLSSVGLPGTSGFVGEFLSLVGIYKHSFEFLVLASTGVILGAVYMLKLYKDVMFGEITNNEVNFLQDLDLREKICLIPLAIMTLFLGIFPSILTDGWDNNVIAVLNILGK